MLKYLSMIAFVALGMIAGTSHIGSGATKIVTLIDQTGTIEGATHMKTEYLPVFDCALKPAN